MFAVRLVFSISTRAGYEERITLWHSQVSDDAIARSEHEAEHFCRTEKVELIGGRQVSQKLQGEIGPGACVWDFSRSSELDSDSYVRRYIQSDTEFSGVLGDAADKGTAALGRESWYSVRCLFESHAGGVFRERITLWRAVSFEDAALQAEAESEAFAYANDWDEFELAQGFLLRDDPRTDGAEVYSLMRRSELEPEAYLKYSHSLSASPRRS